CEGRRGRWRPHHVAARRTSQWSHQPHRVHREHRASSGPDFLWRRVSENGTASCMFFSSNLSPFIRSATTSNHKPLFLLHLRHNQPFALLRIILLYPESHRRPRYLTVAVEHPGFYLRRLLIMPRPWMLRARALFESIADLPTRRRQPARSAKTRQTRL